MADELKIDLNNCQPIMRPPATASGDCDELESSKIKSGQTSDWTLPPEAFQTTNPTQDYWQDEESELFITEEDGTLITLE
jgi:hypothetical protein